MYAIVLYATMAQLPIFQAEAPKAAQAKPIVQQPDVQPVPVQPMPPQRRRAWSNVPRTAPILPRQQPRQQHSGGPACRT